MQAQLRCQPLQATILVFQRLQPLRLQKQIAVDELGFVPLSKTGAELLFEMLSQRYERGSTMLTSNLPFAEWTEVLGSERLTHHVHILDMNGDSFRLKQSQCKRTPVS